MNTVNSELQVPKESKEILDALFDLYEDIKAGKNVGEITSENLTGLFAAVNGYEQLGEELKSSKRSDLMAYGVKRMADAFAPVKSEA